MKFEGNALELWKERKMKTYIVRKTKCRVKIITRYISTEKNSKWASVAEMKASESFRLLFCHNITVGERKRHLTRWGDKVKSHGDYVNGILLREQRSDRLKVILKEMLSEKGVANLDYYINRISNEFTIKERVG